MLIYFECESFEKAVEDLELKNLFYDNINKTMDRNPIYGFWKNGKLVARYNDSINILTIDFDSMMEDAKYV